MERLAIVARLKEGSEPRAGELIARGPPFDPEATGFERHAVYLSATEVVFLFEATEVEWLVEELVDDPFRLVVAEAMDEWRPLIDGPPRIAREAFFWEHLPP